MPIWGLAVRGIPACGEQMKISKNIATKIFNSAKYCESLAQKSNKEIVKLLMNEVWSKFDLFSKSEDIISEAMERLMENENHKRKAQKDN